MAARAAAAADATPAAGTTRSTSPPPPPAAPPSFDDEAFDEEWPSPPTRSIPAPVHRSAAPPPPAPPPPAKAPKPKAARTPSGEAGEPLARKAFGLALASIVLFGVPAIPALIVAGRARRRMAGKGASPLITAARIVAVLSLVAWLTVAGILIANAARPEGVDYAELKAGDCIDTPETSEVRRLRIRSCEKPHDAEVFAVIIHPAAPGDAFPGAEALLQFAANACLGQPFTDYVGTPRGQSQLTEFEIVPESEAWSDGRRGLVCAVDNADRSPLTASVKGSAR